MVFVCIFCTLNCCNRLHNKQGDNNVKCLYFLEFSDEKHILRYDIKTKKYLWYAS